MKAYIQTDKKGEFFNVNVFIANEGFNAVGWETFKYCDAGEITDKDPETLVMGGIGNVRKRLELLGIHRTKIELDYPPELAAYFKRKIWTSTIQEVFNTQDHWNLFVKPKDITKKFTGKVVREYKDFIGIIDTTDEISVWCSEVAHFVTEWRCFVRYGQLLDIRYYKGAWDSKLDLAVIKQAIDDFKSAPASYGMDFGIDQRGNMVLVEVNDGHSLGTYGLSPIHYAKFLSARWAELTKTRDYLNF